MLGVGQSKPPFLEALMKRQRNVSSVSLSRSTLSKLWAGAGAKARGIKGFGSWETDSSLLPQRRAVVISPKSAVRLVYYTLEISCDPFVKHCLFSFLLTPSHCVIAFCWLWPISPCTSIYKKLYLSDFLRGVTWVMETSWVWLSVFFTFSSFVLPLISHSSGPLLYKFGSWCRRATGGISKGLSEGLK